MESASVFVDMPGDYNYQVIDLDGVARVYLGEQGWVIRWSPANANLYVDAETGKTLYGHGWR
jgi:hypothetical protein